MKAVVLLLCAAVALTGAAPKGELVKKSTRCPKRWTKIGGRCFYYSPAKLNWAQAEKKCLSMKANLASVHSRLEYRAIQMMITTLTHGFGKTWLGGTDCQIEGVWLWSDGSAFDYMHCGKFNNGWWREHCAIMNYGEHKCMDDQKCSYEFPSVCAKAAG